MHRTGQYYSCAVLCPASTVDEKEARRSLVQASLTQTQLYQRVASPHGRNRQENAVSFTAVLSFHVETQKTSSAKP